MTFIEQQIAKITDSSTRIVYPEGNDPTIILAAVCVREMGFASPILIGNRERIEQKAADLGVSLEGIVIQDPEKSSMLPHYAKMLADKIGLPVEATSIMLKQSLYFGAMMVSAEDAECVAAGIATESDEVVAAFKLIIGLAEDICTPSCLTLQEAPNYNGSEGHMLAFADLAINIAPTSEELADIAIASARTCKAVLDWEPRVAMLSFSTCGSSRHERSELVVKAVTIANEREPDLMVDGEFQLDAAIVPEVAAKKVQRQSYVAGKANILVFPNLDAANIAVKLLQRVGGTNPSGSILQGFAKPVSDMSRGFGSEDVVRISVILTRLAQSSDIEQADIKMH